MRRITSLILLTILFLPCFIHAQEFNAGIVQGLWYSQEKVFVNDNVRIYVAIRNNTGSDLSGTVEFFDGDNRIGRKSVQALDGRIIESWADWKPAFGSHTLSANLSRIELHKVGSSTQAVEVTSALAEDVIFVDHDTDNDQVGNEDDADDDGDGKSDAQEKQDGSDPLKKDTPVVTQRSAEQDEETEDTDTEETNSSNSDSSNEENTPAGLEQFLSDSPAENVFTGVTNYITTAKQNLDTYREERKEKQAQLTTSNEAPQVSVNEDGFGEISRSTGADGTSTPSVSFDFSDFFSSVFKLIGVLWSSVYTLILTALSFVLSHPILVQVGLLILILLLLIKFASKFGRRPKNFK